MNSKNFKMYILSGLVSSMLLVPSSLSAENLYQGTSVGLQSALFGFGANIKGKINNSFGVKVSFEMASADDIEIDAEDLTYNFDVDLHDMMFLADWHPWQGSFKTTAGLMINGTNVEGRISPNEDSEFGGAAFTFNDVEYSTKDIGYVDTKVDFDPIAPYVGIGWDTSFNKTKGFGFTFDLGIAFQGAARVEYDVAYTELKKTGNESVDKIAQDNRDKLIKELNSNLKEEKKILDDELDKYQILPYISIGVNYKF
jgi:hypothetical protein